MLLALFFCFSCFQCPVNLKFFKPAFFHYVSQNFQLSLSDHLKQLLYFCKIFHVLYPLCFNSMATSCSLQDFIIYNEIVQISLTCRRVDITWQSSIIYIFLNLQYCTVSEKKTSIAIPVVFQIYIEEAETCWTNSAIRQHFINNPVCANSFSFKQKDFLYPFRLSNII